MGTFFSDPVSIYCYDVHPASRQWCVKITRNFVMLLIFLFVRSELEGRTLKIQNSDRGDFMPGSVLLLTWCYCCLLTRFMVCFWHRWRCLWHRRWHFFWEVVWKKKTKQNLVPGVFGQDTEKKPFSDLMRWYFFLFHFPHFNKDTFPPSSNKSATLLKKKHFFSIMTHFDVVVKCDLPVLLGKCIICGSWS